MTKSLSKDDCRLGELITLKRGFDLPSNSRDDGTFPIVSSSGITGSHAVPKVRAPGVVTGRCGTLGKVFFVQKDFWPLNTTLFVENFKGNDPRYIAYLLQSLNIAGQAGAAAVPGVNRNVLHQLKCKRLNVPTQQEIAATLGNYDDLIGVNERRIEILEEILRKLYAEWFVHFRFPGHKKAKFVDSGTPYGRIPAGWQVKKLEEVLSFVRGRSYSSLQIDDKVGAYYIVNLKSFNRGGGFRNDGAKYYTGPVNEDQFLKQGDVVVAVTDMTNDRAVIARPARVPNISSHKVTFSADVVKIISDVLPSNFIYYCLSDYRFTEATKNKASGANVLHLKPSAILEYISIIPSKEILGEFVLSTSELISLIDNIFEQNLCLSHTRDVLVPELVSGKRTVKHTVADSSPLLSPYQDAVTFSVIVRDLVKTYGKSPSRFEVQKNKYFVDRFFLDDIRAKYSAMPNGPYDKTSRYKGGESIAVKSRYISRDGDTKFKVGSDLYKAEKYYSNKLSQVEPVLSYLRSKTDTELEILTTTDYVIFDLVSTQHRKVTARDVLEYIQNHPIWKEKIQRLSLTEEKIAKFMVSLKELSSLGIRYPQI